MSRDDGGPAFPHTQHRSDRDHQWQETVEGMSLRDYMATNLPLIADAIIEDVTSEQALAFGLPYPQTKDEGSNPLAWVEWRAKIRARLRYIEADAMIAERSRTP